MRAIAIAVIVFASTVVAGQTPPQAPAGGAAPGVAPQAPAPPPPKAPTETYTYSPEGRRDPFLNLLGTGGEPRSTSKRTEGPATMAVADIMVRGILQSRGGLIAMVQGPDNKTYVVHKGDKFLDGSIKSITPQSLVIIQEVNDPLSLVKQREVHKVLRPIEDGKE